ncbi:MAG: alpha/beta hydrolase, partial [Bacteroidales bacterium]|nr:alpha/beta hydrolase [Bacteroidales bacterium]
TQDMGDHKIGIETKNTALLMIRTDHFAKGTVINCQIDSTEFQINTGSSPIWFRNEGEQWVRVGKIPLWEKSPVRGGGFKDAFRHHMVFVYGTTGNRDENKWAFDKARFDAETFWYRGNGSVDVIADRDFVPADNPDCNIILYGNAETNSAYRILLDTCPVQIDRKQVRVGTRVYRADNLGVYFIYPRKGTSNRSVGVIAGTGSRGMGAVWPNRYFTSGSGFPDLMVVSSEMLERGLSGILLAGYFGQDWSVINGDWSDR